MVPAVAGLAVLLIAAGGLIAWLALQQRHRPATPAATSAPAKTLPVPFSVLGTFELIDDDEHWKVGQSCEGTGGYSDIRPGTQVIVSSSGETLGLGSLFGGTAQRSGSHVACRFGFAVIGVPAGRSFYAVTVSHRGEVQFAERDLSGEISLSLGG
jgi:hypothetical protein